MDRKELSPAGGGDERTPDKKIGEVKYAENSGAGESKTIKPSKGAQKSQLEGPAAYAPQEDEPTTIGDEAQKRRDKMQRQEKAEGDRH